MQVSVILHSTLRDKLPSELKGKTTLRLSEGATVMDVIKELDLSQSVKASLNDEILQDIEHPLADGDLLRFFRMAGGG